MITKLNSNLLDVTIHFTDNVNYYSYSISEIYDPKKADFFKQFFNYDPIVCDVTCNNDLVSRVIHNYLHSDYIFDIIENLNELADGETEDQFLEKLRLVHVFYECVGGDIMTACKCIEDQSYIELSDCVTEQDLGAELAYERGIFDGLNNISGDIDFEHYFDFAAYGRDCRITEDWEYYDGSYWHFDY
jgi:hypothetical protein